MACEAWPDAVEKQYISSVNGYVGNFFVMHSFKFAITYILLRNGNVKFATFAVLQNNLQTQKKRLFLINFFLSSFPESTGVVIFLRVQIDQRSHEIQKYFQAF